MWEVANVAGALWLLTAMVKTSKWMSYRKWSNKRPGHLLNFRGSRGAFNGYEAFIREGRLFQFNWNVNKLVSLRQL